MKKITPKQERFCQLYIANLNAKEAAIACGAKPSSAKQVGHQWLIKPHVAARVAELQKKAADKHEISAARVLEELARVAFGSMQTYVTINKKGGVKVDLSQLSAAEWGAIESVETRDEGVRIKLSSKLQALDMLGRHLKLFSERIEFAGDDSFIRILEAARNRVSK